jgi:hypothetical protein
VYKNYKFYLKYKNVVILIVEIISKLAKNRRELNAHPPPPPSPPPPLLSSSPSSDA